MKRTVKKGASKLRKLFSLKADSRGDTGIGTLVIFIAMVLVAAVASTVLIHTAGSLQQRAQSTGQQTTQQVSTGLTVTSIYGINSQNQSFTSGNIRWIAIYIGETSGSTPVNLGNVSLQMTYKGQTASLTYVGGTAANGTVGYHSAASGTNNVFDKKYFDALNAGNLTHGTGATAKQNSTYSNVSNQSKSHFAVLTIADPTSSLSASYPVVSYGDQVALLVNVTAVFGNGITQGQSVTGTVTPPSGNPGVIQFTAPESFTQAIVELQ